MIRRQVFTTPEASSTVDTSVLEGDYGEPLLSVFWKRLHSQLAEAVGGSDIELGMNCQDVEELPDGVLLRFEGGATVKAKCVLAADGIHSCKSSPPSSRFPFRRSLLNCFARPPQGCGAAS